jgi:succinate dehydrogenase/fumarate reductase-like Fe-S protein
MKHYLEASEDFQQAPKCLALGNNSCVGNTTTNMKPAVATDSGASTRTKPSHLTNNERSLLHKHQGCMKCHCGYQTHHASDCPFDFPDPHNYKELTEELLLSYKCGGPTGRKTMGVVMLSSCTEDCLLVPLCLVVFWVLVLNWKMT